MLITSIVIWNLIFYLIYRPKYSRSIVAGCERQVLDDGLYKRQFSVEGVCNDVSYVNYSLKYRGLYVFNWPWEYVFVIHLLGIIESEVTVFNTVVIFSVCSVWDDCSIIFCQPLHIKPGKATISSPLLLRTVWCVVLFNVLKFVFVYYFTLGFLIVTIMQNFLKT